MKSNYDIYVNELNRVSAVANSYELDGKDEKAKEIRELLNNNSSVPPFDSQRINEVITTLSNIQYEK